MAQSVLTNWPGADARLGLGINTKTHQILEFANVAIPINNTLSASLVGVRFGSTGPYQYGGGTLNAGLTWNAPLIGPVRPGIGTGALFNGSTFASFTAASFDKLWTFRNGLSITAGVGVGYLTSQKGFDALAGVGLSYHPQFGGIKW